MEIGIFGIYDSVLEVREILGLELVVNGGFVGWTGDNPDGWIVEEVSPNLITQVDGKCRFITTGASIGIHQYILEIGARYLCVVSIDNIVGSLIVNAGFGVKILSAAGDHVFYFNALSTIFQLKRQSMVDALVSRVSVKRVSEVGASSVGGEVELI